MDIKSYLAARSERQADFASRAGVGHRTLTRIINGEGAHIGTLLKIRDASHAEPAPDGGVIDLADLIPVEQGDAA